MRADFTDATVVQHNDSVGILNGGKAMRDDDGRASGHQFLERVSNQHFRFRVDAGGRFIEHQYLGVVGQCSRKGQQLFLPHRN